MASKLERTIRVVLVTLDIYTMQLRKLRFGTRVFIVGSLCTIALLTIFYEVAALCTLDKMDSGNTVMKNVVVETRQVLDIRQDLDAIHAEKVLSEFEGMVETDLKDLVTAKVQNTVHYVWCPNKTLEFKQYLGIISIWKVLRPDILEFHHQHPLKSHKYNNWIDELQKSIPAFFTKPLPLHWDGNERGCGFWFGLAVLDDRGGIYVGNDVVLTNNILAERQKNFSVIFMTKNSETEVAVAMANHHDKNLKHLIKTFGKGFELKEQRFCSNLDDHLVKLSKSHCIKMDNSLHPKDLWALNTRFGAETRILLYGSPKVKEARPILQGNIPKIVHYVWFGEKEMDFMMYLSILSAFFILKPELVFIHGDGGLHGKYLELARRDKRVKFVYREKPYHIFGKDIVYRQHRSDIVRADVLLKYGGIYNDWDVLWLKDPNDIISKGYDAIANVDHMPQPGFPDTINLGVFMAKPKSTFVKRWQDALVDYRSRDFLYNAIELPYKIYEKYPEYLYIERRLQVMCFRLKCHPAFQPNFKLFMEEQPFDWRKDVYSIHFTYPDPEELKSGEQCRNGTGRFAEIGRFILQHEEKLLTL